MDSVTTSLKGIFQRNNFHPGRHSVPFIYEHPSAKDKILNQCTDKKWPGA
jgi:hypothetical protein